ncbi:hypothetical protein [Chryseobacterium balustinum]|uniref:Uncharacterized protein n=1 Tax=Chryseobacterium balustinum TaxID=246 RepID=A0AAX2IRW8_9FLAO|nr:hypothetical protein [Chryseobacterium balustinum]AZB28486.1 hypothetical protein EB354_03965 [Chryseobacterium balustinum]SKC10014.1 hypothetical protein SAMN05421800_13120 [Chryseobacterium balustinum]SQA92513.1 Uncharacterised protein [Chryseobacterium balustinum]
MRTISKGNNSRHSSKNTWNRIFNLLENSIEGASIKIAGLLDRNLPFENNYNSSFYQNNNLDRFDIEDLPRINNTFFNII